MSEQTCECKNCYRQFVMTIGDEKRCPHCGSKSVTIVDIAF